ncbi:hypothetical protein Cch01nite_34020 [Cellulomonas chitinilytica]|uniref:DUF4012 domain-containing protein n=1 Tax=Cellulomonas chitinilytica TaxID=398759 RepID=A0A919P660_9CELL|nr:DUF4012 domain-containing protein [Cellulomonas chitinilytica]GIG22678.1 hypothetical protein Cch01nite_34020 [Cellulomonas chitinilytica]
MGGQDEGAGPVVVEEGRPGPAESPHVDGDDGGVVDTAPPPRRHRLRRVVLVVALVLLVLALLAGWLMFRGYQAAAGLLDAKAVVADVQHGIDEGDATRLGADLAAAQDATARARAASHDPVWRAASHLPRIGPQLAAVSTLSAALDDVTHDALPAAADLTALVGEGTGIRDADGRIVLAPLAAAAPSLADAATVARSAQTRVDAIDTDELVGALAGPVRDAQDALAKLSGVLGGGAEATALLPSMLGADGPRTYLVVALNSAELRSAGGIVGSLVLVHADDGLLSIGTQLSTNDLRGLAEPVLPLTDAELATAGPGLGKNVQNAVQTPDFPRSAELLAARWKLSVGDDVDGVVATDPVAVAGLLRVLGPVTVPDGGKGTRLTADTMIPTVLRDSYLRFPDALDGDRFFTSVAATIFSKLTTTTADPLRLAEAAAEQGQDGRIRVWSAHPDEQRRLAATNLGAAFLTGDAGDATGVFLNDATMGKVDYYLRSTVTVEDLRCTGDDPTATIRVDLSYDPPADIMSAPPYVLGHSAAVAPGSAGSTVSVYAPVGANLGAVRLDDGYVGGATAETDGREVEVVQSVLAPGARQTFRFDVPVRDGRVDVWTTPTVASPGFVSASCSAP